MNAFNNKKKSLPFLRKVFPEKKYRKQIDFFPTIGNFRNFANQGAPLRPRCCPRTPRSTSQVGNSFLPRATSSVLTEFQQTMTITFLPFSNQKQQVYNTKYSIGKAGENSVVGSALLCSRPYLTRSMVPR